MKTILTIRYDDAGSIVEMSDGSLVAFTRSGHYNGENLFTYEVIDAQSHLVKLGNKAIRDRGINMVPVMATWTRCALDSKGETDYPLWCACHRNEIAALHRELTGNG